MDLGQVFTKRIVAEYMVSLFDMKKNSTILDPCFGAGAFLSALKKDGRYKAVGYEIDSMLYGKIRNNYEGFVLKNDDFLQAPETIKYDGIIMNPPYVRHERINDLADLGVSKDVLLRNSLYSDLPSTANLYMYFIIKAISLLKTNGELIVIFPGSWLQARNGNRFQTALYKNCSVERHINISGDVFEESALVDVLILKIRKDGKNQKAEPEYIRLKDGKFEQYENGTCNINIRFSSPFSSISRVRRGLTTGYNTMFINPAIRKKNKCVRPIISSPKQISGYSTVDALTDELLVIDKKNATNDEVADFLSDWADKILEDGKPETLAKKIREDKEWYKLKLFDCEGIIFSYFVRNDMKFIYNGSDRIIRDNFYVLYPTIDKWLCFALLNNLYTYYQLECVGKKYGAGLLKIQRYDIENLMFPNIDTFTETDEIRLQNLGRKLAETGEKSVIQSITEILSRYSDISYESILFEYEEKVKDRLENV